MAKKKSKKKKKSKSKRKSKKKKSKKKEKIDQKTLDDVLVRRGFIWPASEIYGGVAGFYDYGPIGALLKDRIADKWREYFVIEEGFFEIDAPTLMPEDVFSASGHLEKFSDPMVECKKCGEVFRADLLAEEATNKSCDGLMTKEVEYLLESKNVKCPECDGELGKVWDFNLMLKTDIGAGKSKVTGYLRPETAQGMFLPFRRLWDLARKKLPFGVSQIGKAYRNEISPRRGLVRLREFNQMEVEVFVDSKKKNKFSKFKRLSKEKIKIFSKKQQKKKKGKPKNRTIKSAVKNKTFTQVMGYYLALSQKFLSSLGIPKKKIRFRQHLPNEVAHYSSDSWDIEVYFPNFDDWVEVCQVSDRTDYDLSSHGKASQKKMEVSVDGKKIVPHVIEPSFGLDRIVLATVMYSLVQDKRDWIWFEFPRNISPMEVAVFPLVSKDKLPEKAEDVFQTLREKRFYVYYDDSGSIGRRYARQDEIGTPACVTIDHQTKKDKTVTLRDRDTKKQIRVKIKELPDVLTKFLSGTNLKKLGKIV